MTKSPSDEVFRSKNSVEAFFLLDAFTAPFTIVMADVIADKFVVIMVPAKAANTCNFNHLFKTFTFKILELIFVYRYNMHFVIELQLHIADCTMHIPTFTYMVKN